MGARAVRGGDRQCSGFSVRWMRSPQARFICPESGRISTPGSSVISLLYRRLRGTSLARSSGLPVRWPSPLSLILGLIVTLAWSADFASAQAFGQNKVARHDREWRVLHSPHFDFHYYPEEKEAAREALLLAERAYTRLSRLFDHEVEAPIPLLFYASQTEFRETRAVGGLIGEGTGGVTELLKRRVVVPFLGSYAELDHVITHELVHAFQVDILSHTGFGRSMDPISWAPPLWVMEGLAEYLSTPGINRHTEMWMRDAVLDGTLLTVDQLSMVGDIRVYRFGQSLVGHIAHEFGDEMLGVWFRGMARRRSLSRGTEETVGLNLDKLSADWADSLRHRYLPDLLGRQKAEAYGRRLTDHAEEYAAFYISPAVSPDGGEMVFISDESLYTDLYLASAIDGSHEERLLRGQRKEEYESFRFFRSSINWAPDGDHIALVTHSDGREQLIVYDVRKREVVERYTPDLDEMLSPCWSPDGTRIAFVGTRQAQSDLYLLDRETGLVEPLTVTRSSAYQPAWSPDGNRIIFVTDQGYVSARRDELFSPWRLASLELSSGDVTLLPDQWGKHLSPHWFPDGRHLLFVSDRAGIPNLFIRDMETGMDYQITDLTTGISGITEVGAAASLSANGHRVVFSVYERGGLNLYAMRDPLSRLGEAVPWRPPPAPAADEVDFASWLDALEEDEVVISEPDALPPISAEAEFLPGPVISTDPRALVIQPPGEGLPLDVPPPVKEWESLDLAEVYDETWALPDSLEVEEKPYKPRLSIDYAQAGGLYASGFGVLAQSTLVFSDMLGEKNLQLAVDVAGSLEEGNYLIGYSDLGSRPAFGIGLYQYWTGYGYSGVPGYLEDFEQRLLRGMRALWLHPISRFRRVEAGIDVTHETRYLYTCEDEEGADPWDCEWTEERSDGWYLRPEAAWVYDSAVWGSTGPMSGRRTRVSGYATFGERMSQGWALDHRLYYNISRRYAVALRGVFAGEWGDEGRRLIFGGPYTMRGFTDHPLYGSKIAFANLEFRFPFIEAFYLGWPLPLFIGGVRGALFCDVGAAWDDPVDFRAFRCEEVSGDCVLEDLKASVGLRASVNLGIFVLRWDLVRRSAMTRWSGKAKGEVSIGYDF